MVWRRTWGRLRQQTSHPGITSRKMDTWQYYNGNGDIKITLRTVLLVTCSWDAANNKILSSLIQVQSLKSSPSFKSRLSLLNGAGSYNPVATTNPLYPDKSWSNVRSSLILAWISSCRKPRLDLIDSKSSSHRTPKFDLIDSCSS